MTNKDDQKALIMRAAEILATPEGKALYKAEYAAYIGTWDDADYAHENTVAIGMCKVLDTAARELGLDMEELISGDARCYSASDFGLTARMWATTKDPQKIFEKIYPCLSR